MLQVRRRMFQPQSLPQLAPHRRLLQTSDVSALQVTQHALATCCSHQLPAGNFLSRGAYVACM